MGLFQSTPVVDEELGKVQIWQAENATKGDWIKAAIVAWVPEQNGYTVALFDDNVDFVADHMFTAEQAKEQLAHLIRGPPSWVRYNEEDVKTFASRYGVQNYI